MIDNPGTLDVVLQAREGLNPKMVGNMPEHHRRFLISVKRGEPDWTLLDIPRAKNLPAMRWKLENFAKLSAEKRGKLLARVSGALGMKES